MQLPGQDDVLRRLVGWGREEPRIRALILTSSRARDDCTTDELSDYDVIVAVEGADAFAAETTWWSAYRKPLVGWGDEHELYGRTTYFRGVIYADGVRVDYSIWPAELLDRVAVEPALMEDLDVGYRVLLDKDGVTRGWREPTFRAYIPQPPSEAEFQALFDEFWWDTTYVAKSLRREEVFFAKFALDYDTKFVALRRFLEWRVELDHGWSLNPGAYGRGLERLLTPELWKELSATYVGTGVRENWAALFRTTALFRRVAREIADALGFTYRHEVDDAITAQLEAICASEAPTP